MPELCTDIQAANFPERSVQAAAPEGWVELVGMCCSSGHLLGTVLNAVPSVWGSAAAAAAKKDVKSWLAVPPGAVLCGTRDGWVLQGS